MMSFIWVFLRNVNKALTSSPHTSGYRPSDSLEDVVRLPDSASKTDEDRCSGSADITGKLHTQESAGLWKSRLFKCDYSMIATLESKHQALNENFMRPSSQL